MCLLFQNVIFLFLKFIETARRYRAQCDELTKEIKILNEEKKALQDEVEKLTQTCNASKVRGDKNRNTVSFKRSWIEFFC